MVEIALLLSSEYPSSFVSKTVLQIPKAFGGYAYDDLRQATLGLRVAPTFVIGLMLLSFGALIRLSCYRTLGRLFTFELSVLKEHRLVTTGPYSFVRHPSYTGAILAIIGGFLTESARGSWVAESGFARTLVGGSITYAWLSYALWLCTSLFSRSKVEDEFLRNQFGEVRASHRLRSSFLPHVTNSILQAWVEWASRVKWRLIPGVF